MSKPALFSKPILWGCGVLAAAGLMHGAIWLDTVDQLAVFLREPFVMLREWDRSVVLDRARPAGWPSRAGLEVRSASIAAGGLRV